jgi:hypothetical protein
MTSSGTTTSIYIAVRIRVKSAPPQLRNIADNQISCGVADFKKKLRNCDCGPSKFDLRNSATFRSLLPVPLLSSPFSLAQDGFKNQKKFCRTVSFSGRDSGMRFFTSNFFFMNRSDSTAKNMQKIAEVKLSSFGLQQIL